MRMQYVAAAFVGGYAKTNPCFCETLIPKEDAQVMTVG